MRARTAEEKPIYGPQRRGVSIAFESEPPLGPTHADEAYTILSYFIITAVDRLLLLV
jgi:hypothetical protein